MPELIARGNPFHVQILTPGGDHAQTSVLVFVHDLVTDDLSRLSGLAAPVCEAGAEVVLYDLRGHGRSGRTPTGYRVADAVADLFALLDVLGHRRPVYLVARGFGGYIALNAALSRPGRVAGLVLIDAHGPSESPCEWAEGLFNTLSRAALLLEYGRTWREAPADALLSRTSLLDDVMAAEPVGPGALASLRCPVLALYDSAGEAPALLRRSVPDCTVHIQAGRDPAEILEVMVPWLAGHPGTNVVDEAMAGGGAL